VTQFLVFFLRDSEPVLQFGLKQAQLTSIVVFVLAIALGAWRLRSARHEGDRAQPLEGSSTPASAPSSPSTPSTTPIGDTA
jgi:hypothetical protein